METEDIVRKEINKMQEEAQQTLDFYSNSLQAFFNRFKLLQRLGVYDKIF